MIHRTYGFNNLRLNIYFPIFTDKNNWSYPCPIYYGMVPRHRIIIIVNKVGPGFHGSVVLFTTAVIIVVFSCSPCVQYTTSTRSTSTTGGGCMYLCAFLRQPQKAVWYS